MSFDSQPSKSGFVKREKKCGLLMHTSISTIYFLSCFLSNLSLFSFLFPMYSFVFFSYFFLPLTPPPLYCSWLPLIYHFPWWDLPLSSLNRFLAPYRYPSRTAHQLAGYPATTSAQSMLVAPLSISRKNYLSCFLPLSVLVLLIWITIKLSHHLPLWRVLSGHSPY